MTKAFSYLAVALFLGGCAASSTGIGLHQLESPKYLHDQRSFPLDFVQAQRAVFKHQAACGSDIQFAVDPQHPNYARITKPYSPGGQGWNDTIVLGLTKMANVETKGQLYSYYRPDRDQIRELYQALLAPEECESVAE